MTEIVSPALSWANWWTTKWPVSEELFTILSQTSFKEKTKGDEKNPIELLDDCNLSLEQIIKDMISVAKQRGYDLKDFQIVEVLKGNNWAILSVDIVVAVSQNKISFIQYFRAHKFKNRGWNSTEIADTAWTICDDEYADEIDYKWNKIKFMMDWWSIVIREYKDWKWIDSPLV